MSQTRQHILHAARDLYLQEGMGGVTMRSVAQRVGVTATTLYRHFKDKDALLAAVVDEGFRLFGEYLMRAAEAASPSERFKASGRAYVDFALANAAYYRLMFILPPKLNPTPLEAHVRQRASGTFRMLVDRVRDSMPSGKWGRGGDAETLSHAIWALSHGMVSLYLAGKWKGEPKAFRGSFAAAHAWLVRGYLQEK